MMLKNDPLAQYVNQLQIVLADSGYARLDADWNCSRVCSPYSRLYYISDGEGEIRYGGRVMPLRPGHVYLIPAGLTFDYACGGFMNQLYFHVNVYTADGYDLLSRLPDCDGRPAAPGEIEELLVCYGGRRVSDAFTLRQAVHREIALFIGRSGLGEDALRNPSAFLRRLYPLVRQSLSSGTTQKMLADRMSMSPGALARRFKAETGMTLGRYMDDLLLQRALRLLLSSEESIGRIAERLGFCDQFYFSRYFRQRRQETPSQYRRRLRVGI